MVAIRGPSSRCWSPLIAAYSFARWNTGERLTCSVNVSTRVFPMAIAAIPHFVVFKALGLLDTHSGVILLYVFFNMSFATFYGFFNDVPKEVEQAAMIDGYGRMEVFRKIVFPLIKPGLAVTAVFCLIWMWNEFFSLFPLHSIKRPGRSRCSFHPSGEGCGPVRLVGGGATVGGSCRRWWRPASCSATSSGA